MFCFVLFLFCLCLCCLCCLCCLFVCLFVCFDLAMIGGLCLSCNIIDRIAGYRHEHDLVEYSERSLITTVSGGSTVISDFKAKMGC